MKEKYILKNIRVGSATNSSSSHSIIFNKENKELVIDDELQETEKAIYLSAFELEGTECITTMKSDKLYYLIEACCNLFIERLQIPTNETILLLEEIFDFKKLEKDYSLIVDNYLVNNIITDSKDELSYGLNSVDNSFFQDFDLKDVKDKNFKLMIKNLISFFVLNNKLGILSDLESYSGITGHYLNEYIQIKQFKNRFYIWNSNTGLKIRFDKEGFNDIITPELVDLKITNKCNYNCDFCYQDSTPCGKEAEFEKIKETIINLDKMNTFEIAVAGGDPTELFERILKEMNFDDIDILLNTTTKNYNKGLDIVEQNTKHKNFGAIGFSITNMNEFFSIKQILKYKLKSLDRHKFALQYCPAFFTKREIESIIDYCITNKIRLVHLGYKEVGRGINYKPINKNYNEDIKKILYKKQNWEFLIDLDQAIVDQNPDLKERVVNETLSYSEGIASMYIDLVDEKIGLSSYHNNFLKLKFNNYDEFRNCLNSRFNLLIESENI